MIENLFWMAAPIVVGLAGLAALAQIGKEIRELRLLRQKRNKQRESTAMTITNLPFAFVLRPNGNILPAPEHLTDDAIASLVGIEKPERPNPKVDYTASQAFTVDQRRVFYNPSSNGPINYLASDLTRTHIRGPVLVMNA